MLDIEFTSKNTNHIDQDERRRSDRELFYPLPIITCGELDNPFWLQQAIFLSFPKRGRIFSDLF